MEVGVEFDGGFCDDCEKRVSKPGGRRTGVDERGVGDGARWFNAGLLPALDGGCHSEPVPGAEAGISH